ncbi:MAG: hypothetical protein AAFS12_00170 [Cyanobacteria bacterium J06632_19]
MPAANKEVLAAYKAHATDILDFLKEAKAQADSGCDPEGILEIAQQGLLSLLKQVEPSNELAIALIQDASKIDCRYDRSEFLIVAAVRIITQIENQRQPKTLHDMINDYRGEN